MFLPLMPSVKPVWRLFAATWPAWPPISTPVAPFGEGVEDRRRGDAAAQDVIHAHRAAGAVAGVVSGRHHAEADGNAGFDRRRRRGDVAGLVNRVDRDGVDPRRNGVVDAGGLLLNVALVVADGDFKAVLLGVLLVHLPGEGLGRVVDLGDEHHGGLLAGRGRRRLGGCRRGRCLGRFCRGRRGASATAARTHQDRRHRQGDECCSTSLHLLSFLKLGWRFARWLSLEAPADKAGGVYNTIAPPAAPCEWWFVPVPDRP